jgi:hypothetical protein
LLGIEAPYKFIKGIYEGFSTHGGNIFTGVKNQEFGSITIFSDINLLPVAGENLEGQIERFETKLAEDIENNRSDKQNQADIPYKPLKHNETRFAAKIMAKIRQNKANRAEKDGKGIRREL